MKLKRILSAIALSATFASAAQANNVTVKVTNATTVAAAYTYEYFSGSVSPTPSAISPGGNINFILTSGSDIVSGMRFVYTAGNKSCRFAASHTVNVSTGVPTFAKSGTSIGTTYASCTATITSTSVVAPFNYTVQFQIK